VEFAIEMRKRVTDQLAIMKPEEFGDVIYACDFKGL
jgi:predicted ATP-dependent Lon-type protease